MPDLSVRILHRIDRISLFPLYLALTNSSAVPYVIQCQNCFLAFNLGIFGVGDYRRFAYCGACGTVHIIGFHHQDQGFAVDDVSFDTLGPRTIDTASPSDHLAGNRDLTLSSPVAAQDAFTHCNVESPGRHFDNVNDIFPTLYCGACSASDLRIVVREDTKCPRCHSPTLRNVGGWVRIFNGGYPVFDIARTASNVHGLFSRSPAELITALGQRHRKGVRTTLNRLDKPTPSCGRLHRPRRVELDSNSLR